MCFCYIAHVGCANWGSFQRWLHSVVSNPFFDFVIFLCLVVNIILMATVHYPMTAEFERNISQSYLVSKITSSPQ